MLLLVPLVCFVLRLVQMLASHHVVAAPRCYLASCAFIGIVSQGLARPCSVDLSVSPQTEAEPMVGFADGRKKWGFSAAFQEETLYRVAPSYAEHLVFTSLGEIRLTTTPSGGTCMTACTLHKSQKASSSFSRLTKKVNRARCGDEKSF